MRSTAFIGAASLSLLLPALALAEGPVVRSGESVAVGQAQVVEGDFYGAGGNVTVSGEVQGDAYVAGGTITVNAPIDEDFVAAGGTIQLHGDVADDVRLAGGDVTIADEVDGDVVVFAGSLNILSTADIKGDVLFFGGELSIEGPVGGSVFGHARSARINNSVGGDVNLRATGRFALGDQAQVLGNIAYTGASDIERAQNAVVVGDIQTQKLDTRNAFPFRFLALVLLSILFAALTAMVVFRRHITAIVTDLPTSYGMYGLIGLAVFLGLPFVAAVLMLSVLGIIAGAFLIAAYVGLLIFAWIVFGAYLGTEALRLLTKKSQVSVGSVALGIVLAQALVLIPFIGPLAAFAGLLMVLGATATRIYRSFA